MFVIAISLVVYKISFVMEISNEICCDAKIITKIMNCFVSTFVCREFERPSLTVHCNVSRAELIILCDDRGGR